MTFQAEKINVSLHVTSIHEEGSITEDKKGFVNGFKVLFHSAVKILTICDDEKKKQNPKTKTPKTK